MRKTNANRAASRHQPLLPGSIAERAEAAKKIATSALALLEPHLRDLALPGSEPALLRQRLSSFVEMVALWGSRINLTARPDDPHTLAEHILDSLAPLALRAAETALNVLVTPEAPIADLGSGCGFPGLVLAAALPTASFTLFEARHKRATFLKVAAAAMELPQVSVRASRVDGRLGGPGFQCVTSRASAPLHSAMTTARALLRPSGIFVAFVSQSQKLSSREAQELGFVVKNRLEYRLSVDPKAPPRALIVAARTA